jgi:hypothetical protein
MRAENFTTRAGGPAGCGVEDGEAAGDDGAGVGVGFAAGVVAAGVAGGVARAVEGLEGSLPTWTSQAPSSKTTATDPTSR